MPARALSSAECIVVLGMKECRSLLLFDCRGYDGVFIRAWMLLGKVQSTAVRILMDGRKIVVAMTERLRLKMTERKKLR